MMPQLLNVRIKLAGHRPIRLWLPIIPVLLVFSPLAVLVVVGAAVACLVFHINIARALSTGWHIICALPGTRFDFEQGHTAVLVTIR